MDWEGRKDEEEVRGRDKRHFLGLTLTTGEEAPDLNAAI
jgi:hypothetical protein